MESYLCNINLILSKAIPLSIKSTFWCGQASDAQYERNAEKENSIHHLNKTPKVGKSHDLTFFSICTRKTKAQLSARIKDCQFWFSRCIYRKTLPGFIIIFGSKASFTFFMTSKQSLPNSFSNKSRLPIPMPCSPVQVPLNSMAILQIEPQYSD